MTAAPKIDDLKAEARKIQDEQDSLADQGYSAEDPYMEKLEAKRVALVKQIARMKGTK